MIRVLHYGMSSNLGGIEMFIMNIYRHIDRKKIQFDFIKFTDTIPFEDEILRLGGNIHKVIPRRKNIFKCRKEIQNILEENKYDIFHAHINTCSFIEPIILAKKMGLKIIVHSHNEWKGSNIKTLLLHKLNKRKLNKMLDNALACSHVAGKYMFDVDYNICKNGINLEKYCYDKKIALNTREKLGVNDKTFLIGHVGRFEYQKNHKFLLEIIKKLDNEIDDYKVCLVGDGSIKNEMEELVIKYNIKDKVLFLGIRNDINELMMAFDLFLFPSLFEGLGIVLIEAQATGLKCLVSNTVPKEADMGIGLFQTLSLDNLNLWIDYIKTIYDNFIDRNYYRVSNIKRLTENGYNVQDTIYRLECIYSEDRFLSEE